MLSALAALFNHQTEESTVKTACIPSADQSFAQQWEYVTSEARFNAVCCSRRAGKTYGTRLRARMLMATKPGFRGHYVTLIRRNCKKLFWQPLLEELFESGWHFKHNDTDLILTASNGAWLQALSADDMRDLRSIRGDSSDWFAIDECQEPNDDVLEALGTKVAMPMLMDRGGMLDLLGTVPEVEPCYFSDALDSSRWRTFGWDCFANPHMDPALIESTCREAGIGPGHVIYEREILGKRVKDPSKLAYEYDDVRNSYDPAGVNFEEGPWRHSLGLDLGFQDRDAIIVLAWRRDDPLRRLYQRYAWQENHQDVDMLAKVVAEAIERFRPQYIVGDHGGHGAVKVLKTLEARLHLRIDMKPADVMVSVGLVNDDLRTGRLLLERDSELGSDLGRVQRTVDRATNRIVINKKGYHSDLSEALRYAHHAARHWAAKPPKPEPTINERREASWLAEQKRQANPWR